jgi:nucleoside-diphosphate-sugar epimerase
MRILITGATSQVGRFLLPRLVGEGHSVAALSRSARESADGIRWIEGDIAGSGLKSEPVDALIHIAPLVYLPALLPELIEAGCRRVICFGTTSRYSKARSANSKERDFAQNQADAEQRVAQLCAAAGAEWTIFRPTMIYGADMDRNVTFIRRSIRILGFFPLLGGGDGLRQPVHADDLAGACVSVLKEPSTFGRDYSLTGAETLTYRQLVARIFISEGKTPRFLHIPIQLFQAFLWLISRVPRYRDFNSEMARRMNEDLVFGCADAKKDFGYSPRAFEP